MFNYAKAQVTLNEKTMNSINEFNETARLMATESVAHNTAKKELEVLIANAVKADDVDGEDAKAKAKELQGKLDSINDKWTVRNREFNLKLFGGKDEDKKVEGICSFVSDKLYTAYVDMVSKGATGKYREAIREFCKTLFNEETIKNSAFNHFYADVLATMSSVKYNSNKNIAEGCAYITTINKRTFKKMFCGAIADIVSNNKTLKVEKKNK